MPGLTVLCGGGGVGKTTTAAALGMALARAGSRTLIVTVDPARRLADAMGVAVGPTACQVSLDPSVAGRLWARMPDVRTLADDFIGWLLDDEAACERVRANLAYRELADAIVGTHELLTLTLVELDLEGGHYDHVVLDTAPSRHAIEFLTAPRRLLDVLEMRALRWVAALASVRPRGSGGDGPGAVARWSRGRVEALLSRVVGHEGLVSVASLLGEVVHVRKRWADVVRAAYKRLLGGGARFVLVGAPTGAAIDDIRYICALLGDFDRRPTAFVLNRADRGPPPAIAAVLDRLREPGAPLGRALVRLREEYEARASVAARAEAILSREHARAPVLRLPAIAAREPVDIVRALSGPLEELVPLVR
ncbi:MAG: AAA family ATPase [Deltaproteobacteria bacterium]|nr:AAA family ATPase [Deltaproteobacteria bacterium]